MQTSDCTCKIYRTITSLHQDCFLEFDLTTLPPTKTRAFTFGSEVTIKGNMHQIYYSLRAKIN